MTDIRRLRAAPVLSIRQPWTELILCGRKDVEVRTWSDPYRGPLWLHTGAKMDEVAAGQFRMHSLFTGGLVGMAELIDITKLTPGLYASWRDRHLDFSLFPDGRDLYGWVLANVQRLSVPRKYPGALGLFQIDPTKISDDEIARLVSNSG